MEKLALKLLKKMSKQYDKEFVPTKIVNGIALHFKSIQKDSDDTQYIGYISIVNGKPQVRQLSVVELINGGLREIPII